MPAAAPAAAGASSSAAAADGAGGVAAGVGVGGSAPATFASLGLVAPLCAVCASLGWSSPTTIQTAALPPALAGRDVIALAETGSGKTAAFALPVLQGLLASPARLACLVLAPTRELAFQIAATFEALGGGLGLQTAVLVGGVDMMAQAIALARRPHVVVGTPGRVLDHLEHTRGFGLRGCTRLVLDEADRMLSLDFEEAIGKILAALPRERATSLFSATMTSKVAKLQRACLRDAVRVEVSSKYATVATLVQQYLFIPARHTEAYLAYVLAAMAGASGIIFVATCAAAQRTQTMLAGLGFSAACLHGQMSQARRLGALQRFKGGAAALLVATDVASRGLDIPAVDVVVNFDVPGNGKDYIHRVGRTARAGRAGRAITFVTQYDIELFQRVEHMLGTKLEAMPVDEDAALALQPRVTEALRLAALELREAEAEARADEAAGLGAHKRGRAGGAGASAGDGDDGADGAADAADASAATRRAIGAGIRGKAKRGRAR